MKKLTSLLVTAMAVATLTSPAMAHTSNTPADEHAPIGVMGDHNHKQGEFMLSYRYSTMKMEGLRDGTDDLTNADVLADFMMTPIEMEMSMHMFGGMYGLTDDLTIMAMAPYVEKDMRMLNRMGVVSHSNSEGLGDVKVSGLYTLHENTNSDGSRDKFLLQAGLSLPTGDIDKRNDAGQKLGYGMQLGSGTYDPIIGVTYTHHEADWSWGSQVNTVFRFGENDNDYRLGNEYGATAWIAKNLHEKLSISFRLDGKYTDEIHGADPDLNAMMSPANRTDLKGGTRVDALVGVNFYQTGETLQDHRLAAEFGVPVYQDLNGPQLKTDYRAILAWQYAF